MLVFKAKNVLAITPVTETPYDFEDRDTHKQVKGVSIKGTVTCVGMNDQVAVITVKGKTRELAQAKLDLMKLKVGAPAEIQLDPVVAGGVAQLRA
jgi:Zn-dependent metalloprotease